MFKDVFVLNKDAWHCKLLKYTWGLDHKSFSHICPYFWLSVFTVMISPVFVPIKFFFRTIMGVWVYSLLKAMWLAFEAWEEKQYLKWQASFVDRVNNMDDKAIEKLMKSFEKWQDSNHYIYDTSPKTDKPLKVALNLRKTSPSLWKQIMRRWEEKKELKEQLEREKRAEERRRQYEMEEEQRKRNEKKVKAIVNYWEADMTPPVPKPKKPVKTWSDEERERERIKRNKERINKLVRAVKPIATVFIYTLGGLLTIGALTLLYHAFMWLSSWLGSIEHKTWVGIGSFSWFLIKILVGLAIAIGILALIVKGIKKLGKAIYTWNRNRPKKPKKYKPKRPPAPTPLWVIEFRKGWILFWKGVNKNIGKTGRAIALFSYWMIYPFIWIVKGTITIIQNKIQTNKNNCSSIKW